MSETPRPDSLAPEPDIPAERQPDVAAVERERLLAFFEQAPVAIALFEGPHHVFQLANSRYQAFTGHRPLIGLSFRQAFSEVPAYSPLFSTFNSVFTSGVPFIAEEYRFDIDRGRGYPEESHWNFNLHPVRDLDGRIGGIMAVVIDVTETISVRQELETAAIEREELLAREQAARMEADLANRTKDTFLAMLSHELRNPLAPIVTALKLLRMRGAESQETAIIERQVHALVRLVDNLLDVSRITLGQVSLRRERVEMATIVTNAIEAARPLLERNQQALTTTVPASGLMIDGDPDRLTHVMTNILTNAAKYTPVGGSIAIGSELEGDAVVVRIDDNGVGIDADLLPGIFDIFVQAPQTIDRAQGGLGLGLAIVRSLVTLHGGTVVAHSEGPGKGSRFTVRLPAALGQADVAPEATPAEPLVVGEQTRVLIIDDNDDAADLLAMTLNFAGYSARSAIDGPSGLTLTEHFRPDIVLVDIGLPVMDGYEVARHLRQRFGDAVLIVAVTGYGQDRDRLLSAEAGIDHHLVKPVDIDGLLALLAVQKR